MSTRKLAVEMVRPFDLAGLVELRSLTVAAR
jgi:hypothetical protein